MKFLLVSPNGNSKEYDVDGYEFSQNKYDGHDVVLTLFKAANESNVIPEMPAQEDISSVANTAEFEPVPRPSIKGVPSPEDNFSSPLVNIIGKEELDKKRLQYAVIEKPYLGNDSNVLQESILVTTNQYTINEISFSLAADELVKLERDLCLKAGGNSISIIKEPIIFTTSQKEDKFYIKEEILIWIPDNS